MAKKKKLEFGDFFDHTFAEMSPKDIKDNLEGICYGKEEGNYTRRLSEDEIVVAKSNLAETSITIDKIEEEKKEAVAEFKKKLEPHTTKKKDLLDAIKFRTIRKEGVLYLLEDPENNLMHKVDDRGIVVESRPMLPEERQRVIKLNASNE